MVGAKSDSGLSMKQFNYIVTLETAFTALLLFLKTIGLTKHSVLECFYPMLFGVVVIVAILIFAILLIPIFLHNKRKEKSLNEEIDRFLRNMEKLNDLEKQMNEKRKQENEES